MKKLLLLIFVVTAIQIKAQTDWQRWGAEEVSYELPQIEKKNYSFDRYDFVSSAMSVFKNTYYFLISDLDGDNCPFHPTCSNFFVESVKETNIFQGALMFTDRFTRDLNVFKKGHYPFYISGKFFDPVENYKLSSNEIKVIPSNQIVNQ